MPFCSNKYCKRKNQDLADAEFDGVFGRTKQCSRCRIYSNTQVQRARLGLTRGPKQRLPIEAGRGQGRPPTLGMRDDDLPATRAKPVLLPGDPPKFEAEWQERMWRAWLVEMTRLVRASS